MGRLSDEGNYTVDNDEGTLSNVRQIRIADFIKEVVASRRELDVVPDLVMSGALQHIDHIHIDWTRDNYTDTTLIDELSSAMDTLSRLGKDRTLLRTTEVIFLEDESYMYFEGSLPYCL